MKILKKNGMTEFFEIYKAQKSIANSAYDINFPLSTSDIHLLGRDIECKLVSLRGEDGETSVYEVRGIVFHSLIDNGFYNIALSYMDISLNRK